MYILGHTGRRNLKRDVERRGESGGRLENKSKRETQLETGDRANNERKVKKGETEKEDLMAP